MELKTSPTGIPYMEFDKDNRIAFCNATKTEQGYTNLMVKANCIVRIKLKSGKIIDNKEVPQMYVTDTKLQPLPNEVKTSNPYFKAKYIKPIRKLLEKYTEEGVFSFNNLPKLKAELEFI